MRNRIKNKIVKKMKKPNNKKQKYEKNRTVKKTEK